MTTFALAAEFPATDAAEWRKLVDAALKGASFDKRLVSQTYDGLRIEPLYPRAAGATPVAGRAPGTAWTVMQRVDHPDPVAANKQALHDLENGATGLTLVLAGAVSANGYGLAASPDDARARARRRRCSMPASPSTSISAAATRGAGRSMFAALVKARRHRARRAVDLHAGLDPIGGFAATGAAPRAVDANCRRRSPAMAARSRRPRLSPGRFAVADGRIIHDAGGSEAQELAFAIASARRLSARARSRRRAARCRARHDLFPAGRRRRRISHHRQIPRLAEIVGARRAGLRPDAEAGLRRGRDRVAHDDASAIPT